MNAKTTADTAMQILLSSGEARALAAKAMEAMAEFDFDQVVTRLAEAQTHLREAHRIHTDAIQAEAHGESIPLPALFSHAQDTMMTTDSELRLVRRILPAFRAVAERLAAVEGLAASRAARPEETDR